MKKSVAAIGIVAASALAFFVTTWPEKDEGARPTLEPDLFSFVKPGIAPAPDADTPTAADNTDAEAPQASRHVTVEEAVHAMRARGASEDEVYRMRAANWSPEAANRLAEREHAEAAWKARVDAYRLEKSRLLNAGADQSAVQRLRNARFTTEEQVLLAAYESSAVPRLITPD